MLTQQPEDCARQKGQSITLCGHNQALPPAMQCCRNKTLPHINICGRGASNLLLPTGMALPNQAEVNSCSMRLKLKFLSKCLQLHAGDKFQVLQLLQGEGRGLFAKVQLSGKPLGPR